MYSDKYFNICSNELKMFFQTFVPKENTDQFFGETIAYKTTQFSLTNLQGHSFDILIQQYVSEERGQIYQFDLKNKSTESNSVAISFP